MQLAYASAPVLRPRLQVVAARDSGRSPLSFGWLRIEIALLVGALIMGG